MVIHVLRLSTRAYRDLRITTHCALVSRAFGAEKIYLGEGTDPTIQKTIESISTQFGGTFGVEYIENPLKKIKELKKKGFVCVHLTMYGELLSKGIKQIQTKKKKNVLVVVGSEKVPAEIYHTADFNISVTNQPHSEVAALAVFLHEYNQGKEEKMTFSKAKLRVTPTSRGKKVVKAPQD